MLRGKQTYSTLILGPCRCQPDPSLTTSKEGLSLSADDIEESHNCHLIFRLQEFAEKDVSRCLGISLYIQKLALHERLLQEAVSLEPISLNSHICMDVGQA
jgi:hypothetical protein